MVRPSWSGSTWVVRKLSICYNLSSSLPESITHVKANFKTFRSRENFLSFFLLFYSRANLFSPSIAVVCQLSSESVRQDFMVFSVSPPPQTVIASMVWRLRPSGKSGNLHWWPVEGTKTSTEVETSSVGLPCQPPDITSPEFWKALLSSIQFSSAELELLRPLIFTL